MRFPSRAACAAALFALLLPQVAAAGPAEWEFRMTSQTDPAGDHVYLGEYVLNFGPDNPRAVYVTTGRPADVSAALSGSVTDLLVGGFGKQDWSYDFDPPAARPTDVRLRVEILDRASGEAGTAWFVGRPGFVHGFPDTPAGEVTFSLDGSTPLVLGGNRYDLTLRTVESESNIYLYADVAVAATPEPGTFALAALGLGGLVARLRRPRLTRTS